MKKIFLLLIVISGTISAQEAEITNISATQRTDGSGIVDICYDLSGDTNFSVFSVSAEISFDQGNIWHEITNANGDFGNDITEGIGKCFVWNFSDEFGQQYTSDAHLRITADSAPLPPQPGECTDIDGNSYLTVTIGNQEWMAENLKVTHYNNGDAIQYVQSESSEPDVWENLSTGAFGYYNDDLSHQETYGNLYNWYAVDDERGVCPEGWHVPTDDEWKELEMFLGMSQSEADDTGYRGTNEGSKLAGNADLWNDGSLESNDEFGTSGFTALPSGSRSSSGGSYGTIGSYGFFWSSSESNSNLAWYRSLYYYYTYVTRFSGNGQLGFSVRCLRD